MSHAQYIGQRSWRRRVRRWGVVLLLALLGAAAALGVRALWDSVGSAKHTRYEPVDVPPAQVSPRHERERQEYDRRERKLEKGR